MALPQYASEESIDPLSRLFQNLDCEDHQSEWVLRRNCLLDTSRGYCVIPSVVTNQECCDAVDQIWEFICNTTYGEVTRNDPKTWSIIWPHSVRDTDASDHCCLFRSNGAGYLLTSLHKILADRVFSLLFGTRELHSSTEGFLFRPIIPNYSDGKSHRPANDSSMQKSCASRTNSTINGASIPQVRAMVALVDECGVPSFAFYSESFNNELPREFENGRIGTLNRPVCSMDRSKPDVSLNKGDVLIWRPDLIYSYVDPSSKRHPIAAMLCSMHPAILTPTSTLPMKMQAYKQRQTETYCVDKEDLNQQNPYECIRTRQFFRNGPPLVTMRLAQLFGLVPYYNEPDLDTELEKSNFMHRALIRGVRFLESDLPALRDPTICVSTRSRCKMNEAYLVHLTTKDPADMVGQDKYLGGMASPCGKYVYGVPGSASQVLRIRISDGHMDLVGPMFEGKFKWLRGVVVTAVVMKNDPRYPDGCCLALPCNSASVLKINPSTNNVYTFGHEVLKHCGSDRWHYHGGAVASNGWLYAIPANANRVIKINPVTDEVVYIGPSFLGGQKWFGGITGSDGCIYGIPHNEQSVLKINPSDDSVSLLVLEDGVPLPAGQWKWHGGLRSGDKIYGFPNNSNCVLVIHCLDNRVYTIDGGGQLLKSGRHRIPQDHRYKYLGGATTLDQRYAYLFPCDAERVLRIDCLTDELCLVGPPLLDGENKFQNGFVGRDGCLYGIPQRASGVLQVLPSSLAASSESNNVLLCIDDEVDLLDCGPDLIGVKDKFEGGVLGPDGCIYCIPLRSKVCIKIVPGRP